MPKIVLKGTPCAQCGSTLEYAELKKVRDKLSEAFNLITSGKVAQGRKRVAGVLYRLETGRWPNG